jgi:hypothetical protein
MKKLNKRGAARLLNVAKAVREHPEPKRFSMSCYIHGDKHSGGAGARKFPKHWCGTPACALGTFGSRTDLQRMLVINTIEDWNGNAKPQLSYRSDGHQAYLDSKVMLKYFSIDYHQAQQLFSPEGCGGATTPIEAAAYIEKFVAGHS